MTSNKPPTDCGAGEEVRQLEFTGSKADTPNVTNMYSAQSAGAYREFISALLDSGELSFTCNHVPGATGQELINQYFEDRGRHDFKVTLPLQSLNGGQGPSGGSHTTPGYITFKAIVSESRNLAFPVDKEV